MITIMFPSGCYGTYLTSCIYNYTNLRQKAFVKLHFDEHGSSHNHRYNLEAKKYIEWGHVGTWTPAPDSIVVSLLPNNDHNLDYYNNQFYKQEKSQLISFLKSNYLEDDIFYKLKNNWGYTNGLDDCTPVWILREWCSWWLEDCWADGYNRTSYSAISNIHVEVNEIVESFETMFTDLISKLNLTLTVEQCIINQIHTEFCLHQQFHNAQLRCNNWVECVFSDQECVLSNATIFDEAYIQKLLRNKGYEIYCDGLNQFPIIASKMKPLIYQA